jgi:hypothetical protein
MLYSIVLSKKEEKVRKNVMSAAEIGKAKRRLQTLGSQLEKVTPLMRGNIVTNGKRHPQPYFSLNKGGRTHLIYLGEGRVSKAEQLTANYRRMIEITEEMTVLNMALLKNDAL